MTVATLIRTPGEITADWLGAVLGRSDLELLGTERIGTGQISQSHRVAFQGAGSAPETVVVKLASDDAMSRATGVGLGAYMREIAFYRNLAARIGGPLAHCRLAEYDVADGWFTLVLDDVLGAVAGDQIAGCTTEQARIALVALARIHAPVLGDLALGTADFLNQPNPLNQALLTQLLPGFLERYGDRIETDHAELCKRFVMSADAWVADQRPPLGLVHGDYRLDNLLFGDNRCPVVDWQTVGWGPAMSDVSYFIGGGLSVDQRRAHEQALVQLYHRELLNNGVQGFAWDQCWDGYRRQVFHGIVMTIAASMIVERTPRGDQMFMAWLARNAQQALDLDAAALLPAPNTGRPPALRPDPRDEGRHDPGPEALWNESWYFDAVSDSGDLGLYVRLGRLPNQDVCLYTACVCGPGRPSIMLVDAAAPLPAPEDETAGDRDRGAARRAALRGRTAALPGDGRRHCGRLIRTRRRRCVVRRASRSRSPSSWCGRPTVSRTPGANRPGMRFRAACPAPCASEPSSSHSPARASATIRGARATGGPWTGCGARSTSMTAPTPTPSASRRCPGTASATSSGAADSSKSSRWTPARTSTRDGLVTHARIVSGPGELAIDVQPIASARCASRLPTDGSRCSRARCAAYTPPTAAAAVGGWSGTAYSDKPQLQMRACRACSADWREGDVVAGESDVQRSDGIE